MTDSGQPVHDVRQLLSGTRHLACGADIDDLLEQAADGHAGQLTDHQRRCPACQAALQEFSRVWAPVRSDAGAIRIAGRVVATIARDAARNVPGVRVAFGRSVSSTAATPAERTTLRRHPQAAAGVLGRTAVVDLAIAAHYGSRLDAIAYQVQQRAIAELRAKAGLQNVTVNVTVDDVIT